MCTVIGLAFFAAVIYFVVIWIIALCNSSGHEPCTPGECKTCPFPCENRIEESEDKKK